ncbi:MAG: hypothetical protein IJ043_00625 [Clostridia bacterium]|nr:hypothetical protein [Clostridia bacterium]
MVTKKTRLISGLAAVLMLISMLTVFVVPAAAANAWDAHEAVLSTGLVNKASLPDITTYTSGTGEYKVTNRAGMDKIMELVDGGVPLAGVTIYQMADIDMGWEPFGGIGGILQVGTEPNQQLPFAGTFDGNGFTIDNLYVLRNTDVTNSVGLFGYVSGATLKNIGIAGGLVVGNNKTGAVAGYVVDSKIHNCWNAATVVGGGTAGTGGIAGCLTGDTSEVINSYNLGLIYNQYKNAVGVVGYVENAVNAMIANCYNAGEIVTGMNGYGDAAAPGGLEAYSVIMGTDYRLENALFNTNNYYIKGRGKVRSVAELIEINGGVFSDAAETMILSTDAAAGMESSALTDGSLAAKLNEGELVLGAVSGYTLAFQDTGAGYPALAYQKNGATAVQRVAHESFNVNGAADWAEKSALFATLAKNKDGGWAKASSTRLDNLELTEANDLFVLGLISSYATYTNIYGNGNITLGADIDMAEMDLCPVEHYVPIVSGAGLFTGTFDGQNHVIKNWRFFAGMCGGAPNGGLISRVGASTTVKNIGMIDAYGVYAVEGVAGGYTYATLLVEREYVSSPVYIDNCFVTGTLEVLSGAQNHNNNGAVFSTTWTATDLYITNCWSQVNLIGQATDGVRTIGKIPAAQTSPSNNNFFISSKKPFIGNETSDNGANTCQTMLSSSEYSRADGTLAAFLNNATAQKWAVINGDTTFAASASQGSYTVTAVLMVGDHQVDSITYVYTAGDTVTTPVIEGYVLDTTRVNPNGAEEGSFIMPTESINIYYQSTTADFSLLEELVAKYQDYDLELFTDPAGIEDVLHSAQELLDAKEDIPADRATELIAGVLAKDSNLEVQLKDVYPYLAPLAYADLYEDMKTNNEWAIGSLEDWQALVALAKTKSLSGYTFHFTNDVDMQNVQVDPVGINTSFAFKSTIDGHDYVINNLNINWDMAKGNYAGLVGYANGATIKNLGIASGTVRAYGAQTTEAKVGGFLGEGDAVTLIKLWNAATVDTSAGDNSGSQTTSGIARVRGKSFIDSCYNIGEVKGRGYTGILSGYVQGETLVYNCFSLGTAQGGTPTFVRYNNTTGIKSLTVNSYAVNHTGYFDSAVKDYNPAANNVPVEAYSNGELAWMLNSGYTGNAAGSRVYYTLQDGKTVFGTVSNQTVRVTLTMEDTEDAYIYANAGSTVTLDYALGATYTIADGMAGSIEGDVLTVPNSDTTVVAVTSGLKYRSLQLALEQFEDESVFGYILDGVAVKAKVEAIRAKYENMAYEDQAEVDADVVYLNSAIKFGEAPYLPPVTKVDTFPEAGGYMIYSLSDLEYVATNYSKYTVDTVLYLGADIEVTAGSSANQMRNMKASIDGMGHSIKNVTFSGANSWLGSYAGKFVKNLVMENWTATGAPWQGALLIFETGGDVTLENITAIGCSITTGGNNGLGILVGIQQGSNNLTMKNIRIENCTMDRSTRSGNSGFVVGRVQKGTLTAENIYLINNSLKGTYSMGGSGIVFGEITAPAVIKNVGVYNTSIESGSELAGVLSGNFKQGDGSDDPKTPSMVLDNVQAANNGSATRLVYRQNTNSTLTATNIYADIDFGNDTPINKMSVLEILNGAGAYAANAAGVAAKWEIVPGYAPSIDTDGEGLPVKVSLVAESGTTELYTNTEGNVLGLTNTIFNAAKWTGYDTIDELKAAVFTEDTVIEERPCEHAWSYLDNGNGTHTRTCTIEGGCGKVETVDCPFEYEYNNDNTHTKVCPDCKATATENCKNGSVIQKATCEETHKVYSGCALCGNLTLISEQPNLGHDWTYAHDEGTEGADATHTRTCQREGCGKTETLPCEFDEGVYTAHTTDAKGYTTYTCGCGYFYNVEDAEFNHSWDNEKGIIEKYPSYITNGMTEEEKAACEGSMKVPCSGCDATTSVAVPALTGAGIQVVVPGNVSAGDTIEVTLNLVNNPGVAGMTVAVTYDTAGLTLVGVANGTMFSLAEIPSVEGADGKITMSFVNIPNVTADGAFVTLTFTVNADLEEGSFPIEVELSKSPDNDPADTGAADYDGNYVAIGGSGAFVTLDGYIWGDVNNDGVADGLDAVLIMQYAAGTLTLEDMAKPQAADTNGDGTIDGLDAVLIMQYAAGTYDPAA